MTVRLIYGDEDRMLPWAKEKIGFGGFRRDAFAIGIERDGELSAVAVFDGFTDATCEMHIASDGSARWMTKEFLVAVFSYPFIQCGFESVTIGVVTEKEAVIEFDKHVGFVPVGVRHKAMPGGLDVLVMEMLRENCRWIPKEYRK